MTTSRTAPTKTGKEQWKTDDKQTEESDATRQLVRSSVVRTARRANDIVCVGAWLRRICCQKLSRGINIVVGNLDAHAADGIGVKPVHLDEMLVLNKRRNTSGLQPSAEQVCLLGLAKCGYRFHGRRS